MSTGNLFEPPPEFDRVRLAETLKRLAGKGVYIGTSSWKYPGWMGQIYTRERYFTRGRFSQKNFESNCLAEYAETFPIVCGDFSFYQFPSAEYWRRLFHSASSELLYAFKVPEDVAVLGVDNDPMICEIIDPPLSSIAMNVESAGYEAAKLLDRMIGRKKKTEGRRILVSPTHIVQRQSSDILAVNDAEVASAIRFIRENASEKILVSDVVEATHLGRRTLEQRFKKTVHRSIYDEIRQVRVEWMARLLIETDLPISDITSHFHFTDVEHISRYFKKEKGIGLREFRKFHQPR